MILVVGGDGNMGSRYRTILTHLGITSLSHEFGAPLTIDQVCKKSPITGIIIATPTRTHKNIIIECCEIGLPTLCEKPFATNMADIDEILEAAEGVKLDIVDQYHYLASHAEGFPTYYNYFKHGSDGLAWDCLNIIGHAKGEVVLEQNSPIWRCKINGSHIDIANMDHAYVNMIKNWVAKPLAGHDYIHHAHYHVTKFIEEKCI